MSIIQIKPHSLSGTLCVPSSKSLLHRAILCAALADGKSFIHPIDRSDDIDYTIKAAEAMGAQLLIHDSVLTVEGMGAKRGKFTLEEIQCGESGTTLRFLVPLFLALGISARFVGEGQLPVRPLYTYKECLKDAHLKHSDSAYLPLELSGSLQPGTYKLPGNISSQFISGLLFALPLLENSSEVILVTPLESKGYIDLTLSILKEFGIQINETANGYQVPGKQSYKPCMLRVEPDWSQAAYFLAAGALGGPIHIYGLSRNSLQPDAKIVDYLEQMGAHIFWENNFLICEHKQLKATAINASETPDLVPILAVIAALSDGTTTIRGASRLRLKESNRLEAMRDALHLLGASVSEISDGLMIQGTDSFRSVTVKGYHDHRIVMALSIASICAKGPIAITDARSVKKSYPAFFEDFQKLGGETHVIHMG